MASERGKGWTLCLLTALVAGLCILAYRPALSGRFLFDDVPLLEASECWRGLDKIPEMLSLDHPENACTYRPVRYVTFAIDYAIGGDDPTVLHVSNLIYHLLTALAVLFLLRRWASPAAALAMTALWALHPVQTDAVAYISGRRDVVSTLLFLLALLQLFPPAGKRVGVRRALLGLVLFGLAVQAKEMAVTLPAVVLWAVVCRHAGAAGAIWSHLRRRWPAYLAVGGLAMAFVVYRAVLDPHTFMGGHWWGGSPARNFAIVFSLYPRYVWLVLWPARLVGDYFARTIPLATGFGDPAALLGIALYLGLLALIAVSLRRGWRATAFGLGWFLITLLPVSQIFPHHELFAEHYLYLPSIGLMAAALPLAERAVAAGTWPRRLAVALTCVVALAYAGRTALRAADFQDGRHFYEAAHRLAPDNARITYNLGLTYLEAGACRRAFPMLLEASKRIRRQSPMSRDNLVAFLNCSEGLGRQDVVNELVAELLRRNPGDPLGRAWVGRRYLEAHRFAEAADMLRGAVLEEQGGDPDAVAMLAMALDRDGRPEDALEVLHRWPAECRTQCEQEVQALVDLGVPHYEQALMRAQTCLDRYPDSLLLLELRTALYFSSGQMDRAEADLARMEDMGAPEETLERLRALRRLRTGTQGTGP